VKIQLYSGGCSMVIIKMYLNKIETRGRNEIIILELLNSKETERMLDVHISQEWFILYR
jgi:hypothetical protein